MRKEVGMGMAFPIHDNLIRNAAFVIRKSRAINLILRVLIT